MTDIVMDFPCYPVTFFQGSVVDFIVLLFQNRLIALVEKQISLSFRISGGTVESLQSLVTPEK